MIVNQLQYWLVQQCSKYQSEILPGSPVHVAWVQNS